MDERIEVVPVVKAYPATRNNGDEAVCVAGIQPGFMGQPGRWVRLFPVPFRDLPDDQRFKKWQSINLVAKPHSGDRRPETLRPEVSTISAAPGTLDTAARVDLVESVPVTTTCRLIWEHKAGGATLGRVEPEVLEWRADPRDPGELAALQRRAEEAVSQLSLFGEQRSALQPSPYEFRYRYRCGETGCKGHNQSNVDWELHQAFRKWRRMYPDDYLDRIRRRWLNDMCAPDRATQFFIGNMHQHPASFLVLGVFWPKVS